MLNPTESIHRWLCGPSPEPPPLVLAAMHQVERSEEIDSTHWLDGKMDEVERVIAMACQLELALPKMNERAYARARFAAYWEREVVPLTNDSGERAIPSRLRDCRKGAQTGFLECGKRLLKWDQKAGLPLLCPDDAREEAMRLSRRVVPHLMELLERGYSAHYLCATMPNAAPGELRKGMTRLYRRWQSIMRACKKTRSRPFPIVGAVVVMESPLGWRGDWHPHLNIIVVCNGFLDYGKLRERWHWNIEMRKLGGSLKAIERAFREIIKYSCRTVPEKSYAKAHSHDSDGSGDRCHGAGLREDAGSSDRALTDALSDAEVFGAGESRAALDGRSIEGADGASQKRKAPAMVEWRGVDALEYWRAHKGFRRSRTYGALYGLPKPEKLDLSTVRWRGKVTWSDQRNGFTQSFPLLEFIPGDKSNGSGLLDRYRRAVQHLKGSPDEALHCLQLAKEAAQAWQQIENTTH